MTDQLKTSELEQLRAIARRLNEPITQEFGNLSFLPQAAERKFAEACALARQWGAEHAK